MTLQFSMVTVITTGSFSVWRSPHWWRGCLTGTGWYKADKVDAPKMYFPSWTCMNYVYKPPWLWCWYLLALYSPQVYLDSLGRGRVLRPRAKWSLLYFAQVPQLGMYLILVHRVHLPVLVHDPWMIFCCDCDGLDVWNGLVLPTRLALPKSLLV